MGTRVCERQRTSFANAVSEREREPIGESGTHSTTLLLGEPRLCPVHCTSSPMSLYLYRARSLAVSLSPPLCFLSVSLSLFISLPLLLSLSLPPPPDLSSPTRNKPRHSAALTKR